MNHFQNQWQRRSSSMRAGRPSQDPRGGSHIARVVDRNSRIPLARSSSAQATAAGNGRPKDLPGPPGLTRSKSTLGSFTPQEKMMSTGKITPQPATPMLFGCYSSKKKAGFQKDQRNLHDKEFQKDAYHKILNYFQNNNPSVLKDGDFRPMTIKMFLEMVNHLLLVVDFDGDERIELTPVNYETEIPHLLKQLDYPGQVSKGWLKTVNAPHSWPNVLGLLSFLLSLALTNQHFDPENRLSESCTDDPNQRFLLCCLDGCLTAHNRGEEFLTEVCKDVSEYLAQLMGYTDDVIEKLEAENAELEKSLNDPENVLEDEQAAELEQKLSVAVAVDKRHKEEMKSITDDIENVLAQLAKKERNCDALAFETRLARQEVETIKDKISNQTMSVVQVTEIKQQCENLSKEISYFSKEIEENMEILSRHEHAITTKRDKILQCASTFNRQVIQLEQKVPEVQGLRARTNPESADVVEEVTNLVQTLLALKEKLANEFEESEILRATMQQSLEGVKQKISAATESLATLQQQITSKKASIQQYKLKAAQEEKLLKSELDGLEKRVLLYQEKGKANEQLRQELADKEARKKLYEDAIVYHEQICREQWEKINKHAIYYHEQIAAMRDQIDFNKQKMEAEINQIISELKTKK